MTSLNKLSLAAALAVALTGSASAVVITYPAANVTLSSPASTATNTSNTVTLNATYGVFQNNGNDNPGNSTYTRYYSGTLDFGANGVGTWEVAQFRLVRSDNQPIINIGAFADGQDTISASIVNGGSYLLSGGSVRAPLNFQIRVSAAQYNTQTVSLWFGNNAIAGTEGAADYTAGTPTAGIPLSISTTESMSLNQASLFLNTESWNHSSVENFSLSGFSSSDAWIAVVPEPSTWALLAFSLTAVMVLRRRRA